MVPEPWRCVAGIRTSHSQLSLRVSRRSPSPCLEDLEGCLASSKRAHKAWAQAACTSSFGDEALQQNKPVPILEAPMCSKRRQLEVTLANTAPSVLLQLQACAAWGIHTQDCKHQTKAFTWSTDRQLLQAGGFKVVEHARELGGFLSFSARTRNSGLCQRCEEVLPLFEKLRRSQGPLRFKLATLATKFWIRALLGVSGCFITDFAINKLRAQAVRALKLSPAGSSAMLRLSLAGSMSSDPGFYRLWNAVCMLSCRRCSTNTMVHLPHIATFASNVGLGEAVSALTSLDCWPDRIRKCALHAWIMQYLDPERLQSSAKHKKASTFFATNKCFPTNAGDL